MKKILLSAAFLVAALTGANAQQTISFETSEGYNLGSIQGQNGWTVTGVGGGAYSTTQVISDENFTEGAYSFKIAGTPEAGGQDSHVVGGFLDVDPVLFKSVSYDVYIDDDGGSDYSFRTASLADEVFTTIVYFSYENEVGVLDGNGELYLVEMTWDPATWYSIEIEITDDSEIVYTINGNVVYQGAAAATQLGNIDHVRFVHDNYSQQFATGGVAYLDNLKINVEEGASVDNPLASSFSVYPNPAKDVLNISNSIGAEITAVTVSDINGRTVKQFGSVSQINISDLNAGVYFVNISSNEGSLTKKVVKQ